MASVAKVNGLVIKFDTTYGGFIYVEEESIVALGPANANKMRQLYLTGGHILNISNTKENLDKLKNWADREIEL